MRNRSPAHRPPSSPPAPPWISTMTSLSSLGSRSTMATRISSSSSPRRSRERCGRLEAPVLAADLGEAVAVPDHLGVRHGAGELTEARLDLLDQRLDHR